MLPVSETRRPLCIQQEELGEFECRSEVCIHLPCEVKELAQDRQETTSGMRVMEPTVQCLGAAHLTGDVDTSHLHSVQRGQCGYTESSARRRCVLLNIRLCPYRRCRTNSRADVPELAGRDMVSGNTSDIYRCIC